jgi:hypothetical protein
VKAPGTLSVFSTLPSDFGFSTFFLSGIIFPALVQTTACHFHAIQVKNPLRAWFNTSFQLQRIISPWIMNMKSHKPYQSRAAD